MKGIRPRQLWLLGLGSWLLLVGTPLGASDREAAPAPLRLRELFPWTAQFLSHRSESPSILPAGDREWSLAWTAANALVQSDVVEENLERSGRRAAIDVDFLRTAALRDPGGEIYHLDAEVSRIELSLRQGLGRGLELGVELSLLDLGGGFLDAPVEGFHSLLDADQDGRDNLPWGQYSSYFLTASTEQFDNRPPDLGLGDPVVRLKRSLAPLGVWSLAGEVSLKLPLAVSDAYSSGSLDSGVSLLVARRLGRGRFYLSAGLLWLGPSDLPDTVEQLRLALTSSYVRPLAERWSLHLQLMVSQSPLASQSFDRLSAGETYYWVLGFERRLAAAQALFVAVTENLAHYENSSDISLTFGWRSRR